MQKDVVMLYLCVKRQKNRIQTFIAIPDCEEVHVIAFAVKKQQTDPRISRVYGNNEQYSHDPSLFGWISVPAQVMIYLQTIRQLQKFSINKTPHLA